MAIQKINLLDCLPEKNAFYVTFRRLQWIMLGWIGLLLLLFTVYAGMHWVTSRQIEQLTHQKETLTRQLTELVKSHASMDKTSVDVQSRLAYLTNELAQSKQLLLLLQAQHVTQFSTFLLELSQKTPKNLWIEHIAVVPTTHFIQIQGKTLNAELVPLLMHQLSNLSILKNDKFSVMKIDANAKNHFDFVIQTQHTETEAGKNAKPKQ